MSEQLLKTSGADVLSSITKLRKTSGHPPPPLLVRPRVNIHSHNNRQTDHLDTLFRRTTTAQRSFFLRAIASWNKLNEDTENMNICLFKRRARREFLASFSELSYFQDCITGRRAVICDLN